MVYPTALTIGKHWPKGWKHVVFWSGLKGSIPLALVLGLPDGELKQALVPIAFGVVLVSLLLQGLTVGPLDSFYGCNEVTITNFSLTFLGTGTSAGVYPLLLVIVMFVRVKIQKTNVFGAVFALSLQIADSQRTSRTH